MAPTPAFCAEKQRLLDAYFAASREVLKLQNEELSEVAKGGDLERFDLALQAARSNRDAAKTACMEHVVEHGC